MLAHHKKQTDQGAITPPPLIQAPSDGATLAIETRLLISLIFKLDMRDLEHRVAVALPGLSLLQYGLLRLLAQEGCTLSEVSAKMMVTPSTLVPAIDRLEREGLVVRGKDPNDRRRAPLMLTERARKSLLSIPHSHPDDLIARGVQRLGVEHSQQLHGLLQELLKQMSPDKDLFEEKRLLTHHRHHLGNCRR